MAEYQKTIIPFGSMSDTLQPELLPINEYGGEAQIVKDCFVGKNGTLQSSPIHYSRFKEFIEGSWFLETWETGDERYLFYANKDRGDGLCPVYMIRYRQLENPSYKPEVIKTSAGGDLLFRKFAGRLDCIKDFGKIFFINSIISNDKGHGICSFNGSVASLNDPEQNAMTGISFKNRIILVDIDDLNTIKWSDAGDYKTFNADSFVKVFPFDGDYVIRLYDYMDCIFVLKQNHIYKCQFNYELGAISDIQVVSSKYGCPSGEACVWNGYLYFIDQYGQLRFTGGGKEDVQSPSEGKMDNTISKLQFPERYDVQLKNFLSPFANDWTLTNLTDTGTKLVIDSDYVMGQKDNFTTADPTDLRLYPSSDVHTTNWTTSVLGATVWSLIDEYPANDSDFVWYREDGANFLNEVYLGLRKSTTNYYDTLTLPETNTITDSEYTFETNPETSSAWVKADLDDFSLFFGLDSWNEGLEYIACGFTNIIPEDVVINSVTVHARWHRTGNNQVILFQLYLTVNYTQESDEVYINRWGCYDFTISNPDNVYNINRIGVRVKLDATGTDRKLQAKVVLQSNFNDHLSDNFNDQITYALSDEITITQKGVYIEAQLPFAIPFTLDEDIVILFKSSGTGGTKVYVQEFTNTPDYPNSFFVYGSSWNIVSGKLSWVRIYYVNQEQTFEGIPNQINATYNQFGVRLYMGSETKFIKNIKIPMSATTTYTKMIAKAVEVTAVPTGTPPIQTFNLLDFNEAYSSLSGTESDPIVVTSNLYSDYVEFTFPQGFKYTPPPRANTEGTATILLIKVLEGVTPNILAIHDSNDTYYFDNQYIYWNSINSSWQQLVSYKAKIKYTCVTFASEGWAETDWMTMSNLEDWRTLQSKFNTNNQSIIIRADAEDPATGYTLFAQATNEELISLSKFPSSYTKIKLKITMQMSSNNNVSPELTSTTLSWYEGQDTKNVWLRPTNQSLFICAYNTDYSRHQLLRYNLNQGWSIFEINNGDYDYLGGATSFDDYILMLNLQGSETADGQLQVFGDDYYFDFNKYHFARIKYSNFDYRTKRISFGNTSSLIRKIYIVNTYEKLSVNNKIKLSILTDRLSVPRELSIPFDENQKILGLSPLWGRWVEIRLQSEARQTNEFLSMLPIAIEYLPAKIGYDNERENIEGFNILSSGG